MKTLKNKPKKLLIISPKLFFHSTGPAAQTSPELIFHIIKRSQDSSVSLSVSYMQVLFSFQETDKTPVGIGNLVARLIFESCINDGMNLNGAWDISGNLRSANLLPFKGGLISEFFSDSNVKKGAKSLLILSTIHLKGRCSS